VVLPGIIAFHLFQGNLEVADQAYPKLVNEVLPQPLKGFFAAVLFGAILSSFNSALNSSVTLFGVDIYKKYVNSDASDMQTVSAGKKFGILLAIASMCIAPFIAKAPQGLFGYLQEVNGCYSIPILTIIVVGALTKRVPALAAKIGLISGVTLYIISQFVIKNIYGAENYPHFLHVMAILFVLNVCIMLIIGKYKPRDPEYVAVNAQAVDVTPWALAKPVGLVIFIIVVSTYFIFT
jgi:SSS family solute:Na+ symporter